MTNTRKFLLVLCLVTLWLMIHDFDDHKNFSTVMPTKVMPLNENGGFAVRDSSDVDLTLLKRQLTPLTSNLFTIPISKKKPRIKAREASSLAPSLPPLPFKYLGLWQEDELGVMVDYQDKVLVIKKGNIIDNQYRVVSITQTKEVVNIEFLVISLNQIQHMQVGIGQL